MSGDSALYGIFDKTAKEMGPIYEARNDGVAVRQFLNLIKDVASWDRDAFCLYKFCKVSKEGKDVVFVINKDILEVGEMIDVNIPNLEDMK